MVASGTLSSRLSPRKRIKRHPVFDLVLYLLIGDVIWTLQDQRLEHHHWVPAGDLRSQDLEALFDAVEGRLKILLTFRAFLTGLLLGATGGFIRLCCPGLRPDR